MARSPFEIEALDGPFAAVVDTNVALDIYSRHDMGRAIDNYKASSREVPGKLKNAEDQITYRMSRVRYAWWLVMALDHAKKNTLGFTIEFSRILRTRVPLDSEHLPWTAAVPFVVKTVAPSWRSVTSNRDSEVVGPVADRLLVTMAKEHSLPIITCEEDGDVAAEAGVQGVEFYLPERFINERVGLSFEDAKQRFFERLDARIIPGAIELSSQSGESREVCEKALRNVRDEFDAIWDWTPPANGA